MKAEFLMYPASWGCRREQLDHTLSVYCLLQAVIPWSMPRQQKGAAGHSIFLMHLKASGGAQWMQAILSTEVENPSSTIAEMNGMALPEAGPGLALCF